MKAEEILRSIGMTPTEAVRLLYQQSAHRGEFPLKSRAPNALTVETLDKSDRDEDVESFNSIKTMRQSWGKEQASNLI